jgi:glucose/arabinose dehydrogenase
MQDVDVKSAATTPTRRKTHWLRWLVAVVVLAGLYWFGHGHGWRRWAIDHLKPLIGIQDAPANPGPVFPPDPNPQVLTQGKWDPAIHFDRTALPSADGSLYTTVKIGPDHRLYAATFDGRILRFPIRGDGTLDAPTVIDTLPKAEGKPRLLIGLCFDPASTADNVIVWTTHSFGDVNNCPEWTGKVSRLSGKDLEIDQDVVVDLPRSLHDHSTNECEFGPDGNLYIPQGSNSSCGAPDEYWGMRPERLLNASILKLEVKKVTPGHPIDVKTPDAGGSYDPYARGAPLTIYAGGLRNAYSLVWHRNGHLYAPVNGAGIDGNTPEGDGVEALNQIPEAEHDWLFRINEGKYYGHPNPQQRHFVMNGAHPDDHLKSYYVKEYRLGTQPDSDYEPPILDFGSHCSADGIIEYKGNAFHGHLDGKLMICRYNNGQDILCVGLDSQGNYREAISGEGLTDLQTPLSLTEDVRNGNLYVTEYAAKRIVLLKPGVPSPGASSRPATRPSSGEGSRTANPAGHPAND